MALVVIGSISEDTCTPDTLQELLELFAAHLSSDAEGGGGGAGGVKVVYLQTSQPTGVAEGVLWFEPVSQVLKVYGKKPGEITPSWLNILPGAGTITGTMLAEGTVTTREFSSDVRSQLAAVAASSATTVAGLETFHGGGSGRANFFIMSDGTLRVTGKNQYVFASVNFYKNGIGFVSSADVSILPKRCGFSPPLNGDPVAKVYTMQGSTFAITAAGKVYATGLNAVGQLGLGDTVARTIFERINPANFGNEAVVELAIGTGDGAALSCYARTAAGSIYVWGHNYYGQLGLSGTTSGNTNEPNSPTLVGALGVDNAQIVSAGAGSNNGNTNKVAAYVRKTGGTVYGCGWAGDGNLGQGNTTHSSTFIQIDATNLVDVSLIAAAGDGDHITFYAAKTSGADAEIWACGYNNKGQVGNGGTTSQTAPVQAAAITGHHVSDLKALGTAGNFSVFARLDDGSLRSWGSNANKQLGLGSGAGTANVTSPATPLVQDADSNNLFVADVQLGGAGGKISTALLTRIFTGYDSLAPRFDVYAAGSNQYGQLAQGGTTDSPDFVKALIDTTDIAGIVFGCSNSNASANTSALLIRLNNGACLACGSDAANIGQLGVDASPSAISVPALVNF